MSKAEAYKQELKPDFAGDGNQLAREFTKGEQRHFWRDVILLSKAKKSTNHAWIGRETIGEYQIIHAVMPIGMSVQNFTGSREWAYGIAVASIIFGMAVHKHWKNKSEADIHKPFGCKKCDVWFETGQEYIEHYKQIHEHPERDVWKNAKTRNEFTNIIDQLLAEDKFEELLNDSNARASLRNMAAKFQIYIPPGFHERMSKHWKTFPEMFHLFGFQKPQCNAEEYEILSSPLFVKKYRDLIKKYHPDTMLPSIHVKVAKFWMEIVEIVHKVLRTRLMRYEDGSLRKTEHPVCLTRKAEEMLLESETLITSHAPHLLLDGKK